VDPVLNFGIAANNLIDSVIVIWPNDNYQKLVGIKSNQMLVIKQADAKSINDGNALLLKISE